MVSAKVPKVVRNDVTLIVSMAKTCDASAGTASNWLGSAPAGAGGPGFAASPTRTHGQAC
eukprot:4412918-Alexandrium_andersonii.AAC.1